MNYQEFGLHAESLNEAKLVVESLVSFKLELRESSEWGCYWYYENETIELQLIENRNDEDGQPIHEEGRGWPFVLLATLNASDKALLDRLTQTLTQLSS